MIIADDPSHLGARIGVTAVLPTWGSAMSSGQGAASTHLPPALRRIPCISGAGIEGDGRVRSMSVHRIDHPLKQQKGVLRHTEAGSDDHAIIRAVRELVLKDRLDRPGRVQAARLQTIALWPRKRL